jgi:hypothetical protein
MASGIDRRLPGSLEKSLTQISSNPLSGTTPASNSPITASPADATADFIKVPEPLARSMSDPIAIAEAASSLESANGSPKSPVLVGSAPSSKD